MNALEDNFTDILGKAQRGLRISDIALASGSGLSVERVARLKSGAFDEEAARNIAPLLGLDPDALVDAGKRAWRPAPIELEGLFAFTTPFDDMTVNSYLIWDPETRAAAAFDTGSDCSGMLDLLREKSLSLKLILLTHTHGDHVFELDRLVSATGAPAFVSRLEQIAGAQSFDEGKEFDLGKLRIGTRLTSGHSPGGVTYVVTGLSHPVAVVGDAVFAGSMGGGGFSYADALRNNREKIMTLPDDTVLCPGHGPLTTVIDEKRHNPFLKPRV